MKKRKRKTVKITTMDAIKAMRRGGREAEQELLGPGFHSRNKVHKSKKTYTRKAKHKQDEKQDVWGVKSIEQPLLESLRHTHELVIVAWLGRQTIVVGELL